VVLHSLYVDAGAVDRGKCGKPVARHIRGVSSNVVSRVAGVIGVLLTLGCALPPPKPVLIYVPPSVTLDAGGTVRRPPGVVSNSRTFWEAMASLDTGYVTRHQVTDAQLAFARALGLIMTGRTDDAALALDRLRRQSADSLVNAASRVLVTAMLQYHDNWSMLAGLSPGVRRDSADIDDRSRANVEAWAAAFRNVPAKQISFPTSAVSVELLLSPSGAPMIPVSINGTVRMFWLDTGSSMSIVASDVAADVGVKALVNDTLEIVTATGRVPATPGSIARLQLGGLNISNVTAMIVATELMQVRLGDGTDLRMAVRIDGVIGFDIISRLDMRIDYVNRRVTMARPERVNPPPGGRNLFWVGTPIVRLVTSKGIPLHFNLDTGAQETYSTDGLLLKTKARTFQGERRLVGGLAGLTIVHGRFVDELRVTTGGRRLLLRKLLVFAPAYSTFVGLDGVLGSDVGRSGVVRIDATNGIFALEPQPYDRGLRIKS